MGPRFRDHRATAAFLDAVNVAAVGRWGAVTLKPGRATLVGPTAWAIFAAVAVPALTWRGLSARIVLGSAAVGWLLPGRALTAGRAVDGGSAIRPLPENPRRSV